MTHKLTLGLFALSVVGAAAVARAQPAAAEAADAVPRLHGKAVVVATNEAEIEPAVVRSMVQLLSLAFVDTGLTVVEPSDLASPVKLDAELGTKLAAAAPNRVYVLHVLRLDTKVLLQLDERSLDGQQVLYTTGLVPTTVESSNEVFPRLVDAVIRHVKATTNAQVSDVTSEETGTHNKSHFVLGAPAGFTNGGSGAGISLGYQFETNQFAIGANGILLGGQNDVLFFTDVYGSYYFMPGAISPYASVGLGFATLNTATYSGLGPAASAELGVEALRFNHTHLEFSAQGLFPLFSSTPNSTSFEAVSSGGNSYTPEFLLNARVVF